MELFDGAAPDPLVPEPFPVARIEKESQRAFTIELDAAGRGGFSFLPGQFNVLYAFGVGEVAAPISGDPAQPRRVVHTLSADAPVARALGALRRGAPVGVRGPFGAAFPVDEALHKDVILVASGFGLCSLRPLIHRLLRRRSAYGRVLLAYGAKTPEDIVYLPQLSRWGDRGDVDVEITVEAPDAAWRGRVGPVTALIPRVNPGATLAFLAGPDDVLRAAAAALGDRGLPLSRMVAAVQRDLQCGVGTCGRCQLGPSLVCKDGPALRYDKIAPFL